MTPPVSETKMSEITYPPEMLPIADGPAEVIVVANDGAHIRVWPFLSPPYKLKEEESP